MTKTIGTKAKSSKSKEPTIERSILFFRAEDGQKADGSTKPPDWHALQTEISKLEWETRGIGRYFVDRAKAEIACWLFNPIKSFPAASFGRIRRDAYPVFEKNGHVSQIKHEPNQTICEQTHVVFFEDGVIGVEFNANGPRISSIESYLVERGNCPQLKISALFENDPSSVLDELVQINSVRLRVTMAEAGFHKIAGESLRSAIQASPFVDFDVSMKTNKTDHEGVMTRVKSYFKSFLGSEKSKLVVVGKKADDSAHSFDMFQSRIRVPMSIRKMGTSKAVDSRDAHMKIVQAYEDNNATITKSSGIRVHSGG